jgi:mannose-6-phosphate isomerase-like protein (cupin superfamily)
MTNTSESRPGLAPPLAGVRSAQVLMGCEALEPSLSFFVQTLGFRIDAIFPADDPGVAMLSGHGLHLRLMRGVLSGVEVLYLLCDDPTTAAGGQTRFTAPNGVRIMLVAADPAMTLPPTRQSVVLTRAATETQWGVGRAGMHYRDLLPERHGGAFIASHIRILDGGLVPDYVHFHKIRFQTIFCRKGWVRVVYEGQGEPFIMHAGDCVLQPPEIRHRVLESSAGAEVVELGAPAEHITMADHNMALPTPDRYPQRDYSGQRFVRHIAVEGSWLPWRMDGFEMCDTGIAAATSGLTGVRVLRPTPGHSGTERQQHATEFCFYFVLSGQLTVEVDGKPLALVCDDSITVTETTAYRFSAASPDLELLEVTLPALVEPL